MLFGFTVKKIPVYLSSTAAVVHDAAEEDARAVDAKPTSASLAEAVALAGAAACGKEDPTTNP